ncbi:MAG: hypothetical protein V8R72_00320 [Clostridia bacterium]
MEKLYFKYPTTIGEELIAQFEYRKYYEKQRKNIDMKKNETVMNNEYLLNYEEFSAKIRKVQKDMFRNITNRKGKNGKVEESSVRPATITKLKKMTCNKEISDYFILFSAFKALNIIKEDYNIIELLDYYNITPKKITDKEKLVKVKEECNYDKKEYRNIFVSTFDACFVNIILQDKLTGNSIDEKIKKLYELGLPSHFEKIKETLIENGYYMEKNTIELLFKEYNSSNKLYEIVSKMEKETIKEIKDKQISIVETLNNDKMFYLKKNRYFEKINSIDKSTLCKHLQHIVAGALNYDK